MCASNWTYIYRQLNAQDNSRLHGPLSCDNKKREVDTQPPLKFNTEQNLLLPQSFMTRCFTLADLFAGKMHALVYRAWKNRIKGRDWYDFEWYVRHNVPLDFTHLHERVLQFNQVKVDVLPFVRNPKELGLWSNDYFQQLAKMLRFE